MQLFLIYARRYNHLNFKNEENLIKFPKHKSWEIYTHNLISTWNYNVHIHFLEKLLK